MVIDPYDPQLGLKLPKTEADIVAVTHDHYDHNAASEIGGAPFIISGPGEYEVKGINVVGVATFHDNKRGALRGKNTIYNLKVDGVNIAHLGDLGQDELTNEQIEALGNVDVLMVPVGGVYTIDGAVAAKIVASLEPRVIIPMHYFDKDAKVNLEGVEKFLKEMGKENIEPLPKLVLTKDKLPEEAQTVLLSKG